MFFSSTCYNHIIAVWIKSVLRIADEQKDNNLCTVLQRLTSKAEEKVVQLKTSTAGNTPKDKVMLEICQ